MALGGIASIDDHPEHACLLSHKEEASVSLDTPAKAPELEAVELLQKGYPQRTITLEASVPAGLDGVDAAVGDELFKLEGTSLDFLLKVVVAPESLSIETVLQWLRIHYPTQESKPLRRIWLDRRGGIRVQVMHLEKRRKGFSVTSHLRVLWELVDARTEEAEDTFLGQCRLARDSGFGHLRGTGACRGKRVESKHALTNTAVSAVFETSPLLQITS